MKHLKFYLFALLALPILSTSCKKDDDEEQQPQPDPVCKTVKAYIYGQGGAIEDSVIYTYTGTQITKMEVLGEGHVALEYANNRVSKRSYFDPTLPTTATDYATYIYNTDGTVSKIDYFEYMGGSYSKWRSVSVTYTAGKYNKVSISEDDGTGNFILVEDYTYTYTGNNITTVVANSYVNGVVDDTFTANYTYDTKANYFTKQNPLFMFTDPFLGEFDGTLLPLLVSTNNSTAITVMGMPVATFNYQVDSKDNITRFDVSGDPFIGYAYQCQ